MRYLLLLCLFVVGIATKSHAQSERIKKLRYAQELYGAKQFLEAAAEYEGLLLSPSSAAIMGADAKANLAHCYVSIGKHEKAETLYREVMPEMSARPEVHLYYGECLLYAGKIDEAKQELLLYMSKRPDDPRGAALKNRCDMIENIRPLFPDVSVHPQTVVNRKGSDEFASGYCGNALIFASDRVAKGSIAEWTEQKRGYLDIFIAPINEEGQLEAAKKFPYPINSPSRHDGPASFSRDGKTIYYSQSVRPTAGSEQLSLQIMSATYTDGRWSSPEVLPFVENNRIFSHPCISHDGKHLYFMSDRPGGYGGTDIWVSDLKEGRWMPPRNLGDKINTAQNEGYPFMHPNGSLYFASKGHANFGGYDIFRARPLGNGVDWLEAENLGRPFNSAKDDTYFLLSDVGSSGFVVSKRDGDDNIYQFDVIKADSLRLPADLHPYSAPDFLDLEAVSEEDTTATAAANGNNGNNDYNMSDWKLPENNGKEDETFVDKMIAAGGNTNNTTPKENNDGGNKTNTNTANNNSDNGTNNDNKTNGNNNNVVKTNGGNNSETPSNFSDWNNGNNSNNTTTANTNNAANTNTNKDNRPAEANPTLVVELMVIDANIQAPLEKSKVTVTNLFTKESKDYSVDGKGMVELTLKAEQKYAIRAVCDGYYGSELPVATVNAQHSERKKAYLPLVKKN